MKERITDFFDMPTDVMGDMPRMILVARRQFCLQGQHRLVVCEAHRMLFATVCGRFYVEGRELVVDEIAPGETHVTGKIDRIGYLTEEL